MCDVSSTVGLTRCYKTEGFYAFIFAVFVQILLLETSAVSQLTPRALNSEKYVSVTQSDSTVVLSLFSDRRQ